MKYRLDGKDYSADEFALKIKLIRRTQWEKLKAKRKAALKYYYSHKQECINRVKEYGKKNPERVKLWQKKTFTKWYSKKKNKQYMVRTMFEYYRNNKDKQISRTGTYYLKHLILKKECKCGKTKSLQIHHEKYPVTFQEIRRAIKDNKIYYLCSDCHSKIEKL